MTPEGYTRVYVGGLNESIKKEDLQTEFEKYGKLNKVWVAFNPPGFAFIEFLNMNEAELACSSMNGTEIMGAKLRVEISRGRGRGGGRGGMGGFRGNRGGTAGVMVLLPLLHSIIEEIICMQIMEVIMQARVVEVEVETITEKII